jgi:hypothetical protein
MTSFASCLEPGGWPASLFSLGKGCLEREAPIKHVGSAEASTVRLEGGRTQELLMTDRICCNDR